MSKIKILMPFFLILATLVLFDESCDLFTVTQPEKPKPITSITKTISANVVAGEEIYVVKVNPNNYSVPAQYAGSVQNLSSSGSVLSLAPSGQTAVRNNAIENNEVLQTHHPGAMQFNALPPLEQDQSLRRPTRAALPNKGDSRSFWVQNGPHEYGQWIQITATLKKNGAHCRIWVDNARFGTGSNKIEQSDAGNLADRFDLVYEKETAFFGYERGGGPGGDGGIDGGPFIQILVYDIDDDWTSSQSGGTFGFFWGKDEYNTDVGGYKTNKAEIFYVDAHFTKTAPNLMYSTLVHEFQHMIHYNQKTLRLNQASETWYDEMFSMLAEDMLYRHIIGVNPPTNITTQSGHPIYARIPTFKNYYWKSGVTEWLGGNDVFYSYAAAYAFGAYLVRNYGGAWLLYEMAHNNYVNAASVNAALGVVGGISFNTALEKFPEVLFNTTTSATFNRAILGSTWPSPPLNASDYNFTAFDIGAGPSNTPSGQSMGPNAIAIQFYGTAGSAGQVNISLVSYDKYPIKMYLLAKKTDGTLRKIE